MKNDLFYHPGTFGDIIYAIPFCLSCVGTYEYKDIEQNQFDYMLDICLSHKKNGNYEALKSLKMIGDLLRLQPYIRNCIVDEKVDWAGSEALDLGIMRKGRVNMSAGDIVYRYHFLRRLSNYYNNEDPWLIINSDESRFDFMKGKICVFRTPRYRNDRVNYNSLRKYAKQCIYMGTDDEYIAFEKETSMRIPFFKSTFIDVAKSIQKSAFVVGNQTFFFSLAEALKVPRLCEMCPKTPDVMPRGKWANDFVDETDLEICLKMYANEFL